MANFGFYQLTNLQSLKWHTKICESVNDVGRTKILDTQQEDNIIFLVQFACFKGKFETKCSHI